MQSKSHGALTEASSCAWTSFFASSALVGVKPTVTKKKAVKSEPYKV